MAKKHFDFRPDPTGTGILNKLYLTRKQRQTFLKWLLYGLVLVLLIVIQDVVMSRCRIFGATTDLVSAAILLTCILEGSEQGGVFALAGSAFYWCSGSSPGAYCMILLTFLGVGAAIFRYAFLRKSFGTIFCCGAVCLVLYEAALFAVTLFLNQTVAARWNGFLLTSLLTIAAIPLLYPILMSIGKIGGETWRE